MRRLRLISSKLCKTFLLCLKVGYTTVYVDIKRRKREEICCEVASRLFIVFHILILSMSPLKCKNYRLVEHLMLFLDPTICSFLVLGSFSKHTSRKKKICRNFSLNVLKYFPLILLQMKLPGSLKVELLRELICFEVSEVMKHVDCLH